MFLMIGPILREQDGYAYDSWIPAQGVRRSYPYRRIEDAYYARRHAIEEASGEDRPMPIVCHTSDEFALKMADVQSLVVPA